VFLHFDEVLDTSPSRSNAINLDLLNLPSIDPAGMGDRFTEAEVWAVIRACRRTRRPGMTD
jgi:hypothetical protein